MLTQLDLLRSALTAANATAEAVARIAARGDDTAHALACLRRDLDNVAMAYTDMLPDDYAYAYGR